MQIRSLHLRSGSRLLLVLLALLFLFFLIRSTLYSFLAPNQPPYRGWMIIEGWIEDAALTQAISLYTDGDYEGIYTTGVPLDVGSPLLTYQTYAEMTTARLIALGIPSDEIRTVSAIMRSVTGPIERHSLCAMRFMRMAYVRAIYISFP